MTTGSDTLKVQLHRWTLLPGVLQIAVGCTIGFIPPSAVEWYRGIEMAHIEFTATGVLMVAFGFLNRELTLNSTAIKVWFATLQIGTSTNGAAGVAGAFLGSSSKLMPMLNEIFPPLHGIDNSVVTGLLLTCGATIILALLSALNGLLHSKVSATDPTA